MAAVQLGLLDDAEKLYVECERFDLLNKLYQASGQWDKALKVAKEKDRMNLKTTYYLYAKHLESLGEIEKAIKQYEYSNTHTREVPRMLFESCNSGQTSKKDLERYIKERKNPKLYKWYVVCVCLRTVLKDKDSFSPYLFFIRIETLSQSRLPN